MSKTKKSKLSNINSYCLDCIMFCKQNRYTKIINCPNKKTEKQKSKEEQNETMQRL